MLARSAFPDVAPTTATLTVVVADAHPLFRSALADLVRGHPGLALAGVCADGPSVLQAVRESAPDVAVLDPGLPFIDAPRLARRLSVAAPDTAVLFLGCCADADLVYRTIAGGAAGFLLKHASPDEIAAAIHAVARGEAVLAERARTGLVREIHERAAIELGPPLTAREHEVLAGIAEGRTASEIGAQLHLSVDTVKSHRRSLYAKLGVSDRGAAVFEAMRRGLLA